MYFYNDIPTFDSDDRVWDGNEYIAIYSDKGVINLISCHCGYQIPDIRVYINLKNFDAAFSEWITRL